jgi:hypothetical protein
MGAPVTPEDRSKRFELGIKIAAFVATLLILGPFLMTLLHGMAALMALVFAGAIGLVVINLIPAFSEWAGAKKLQALKSVAANNPIEILENQYREKQEALSASRDNISQSYAVLQEIWRNIQDHNERFPNRPSQQTQTYKDLKALVELRARKYKQAQAKQQQFGELIEEKRSDWKIAKSMAKARQIAKVGEDFQSKLMQDTAITSIQSELDLAFSELQTSLLDEAPSEDSTVKAKVIETKMLNAPEIDLGFEPVSENDSVVVRDQRRAERRYAR